MARRDAVSDWFMFEEIGEASAEVIEAGVRADKRFSWDRNHDNGEFAKVRCRLDGRAVHWFGVKAVVDTALEEWMKGPRITEETLKVLTAIGYLGEASPPQIRARSGLASGTVSPILARLEAAGWVSQRKGRGGAIWRIADEQAVRDLTKRVMLMMEDLLEAVG